jgi:pilus assembly protein Flp/PilA
VGPRSLGPIAVPFTDRIPLRKVHEGPIGGPSSRQVTRRLGGDRGKTMTKDLSTVNHLKALWKDEEGPTAVEYALMLFLVAVAIVTAVGLLKDQVVAAFTGATKALGG